MEPPTTTKRNQSLLTFMSWAFCHYNGGKALVMQRSWVTVYTDDFRLASMAHNKARSRTIASAIKKGYLTLRRDGALDMTELGMLFFEEHSFGNKKVIRN